MTIIIGKVIKGQQYGRQLGFPTANLDRRQYSRLQGKPKLGIWAGLASYQLPATSFPAAIVIGPLDKTGLPKIEAHLIGFTGNLYGKKVTLQLVKYLRPFKKYQDITKLKADIKKYIHKVRKLIK